MVGFSKKNKFEMFHLKIIKHSELTQRLLNEIIQVKSKAWPDSYEKQRDWIYSNIKDADIHVLLYLDGSLIAYLNLIEIEFTIDGSAKYGYGIGNVCAKEKGKGWGKELIAKTNNYLIENDKIGLLFCKELLVDFYKHSNWRVIEKEKLTISFSLNSIVTMIFNCDNEFQKLIYIGIPF
jgi:hypothetical protein